MLRPNFLTKSRQKSYVFHLVINSQLYSFAWDSYFFKLTQPLTVSVKEKGREPDRKPYPRSFGLRNPYRNLKSENSQDYAQKPQRDCTFKNSASGLTFSEGGHVDDPGVVSFELLDQLLCGNIPDKDVLSHPSDGSVLPLQNAGKVNESWTVWVKELEYHKRENFKT